MLASHPLHGSWKSVLFLTPLQGFMPAQEQRREVMKRAVARQTHCNTDTL
jgi:hypothetical protein